MHVLVTGAAGFIGFHLCRHLLAQGVRVVGMDNVNDYYSPRLKEDRLALLADWQGFSFHRLDLADDAGMKALFAGHSFTHVVNLAAQAGVRYSLLNPHAYVSSNTHGFLNVLEGCRNTGVAHLVFASSSSVYGLNTTTPFSTHQEANHPVSLYAATKKSNEMMAHAYSHLYALPCTGLRFFTVYGPWGRPDMALHIFTKAILAGEPLPVFNNGNMQRDFTYIGDIVEGVARLLPCPATPDCGWNAARPDPAGSSAPYRLYNIGNNNSVRLGTFIDVLEKALGKTAVRNYLPMQPGDVQETCADIDDLQQVVGFRPATTIEEGIPRFAAWYREYYC